MKFTINTAEHCYSLKEAEELKNLGFTFHKNKNDEQKCYIDGENDPGIEISSLEQLMELSDKYGDLIIRNNPLTITIYDGYIE